MSRDQYTLTDPTKLYSDIDTEEQSQPGAGLDARMRDQPDLGADTYRGTGRLEGRKALVTGGDSGIGAATAIAFAREGADVALSYLPEEEEDAQKVVSLIEDAGRKAVALPGDLTDQQYCTDLVAQAAEQLGGLDILVNNGGKQQTCESIEELTDEQFDETFKTNVYAMFWVTKAAVAHLEPASTIINTSSIQAYQPSETLLDYPSTKASINTFSKALAQQLAPKGIRVTVVAPGPVWTPLQTAGGQPPEDLPQFGTSTPLGRPGQPAELAPAFVFLASPESSYVTGATIHVNGGAPVLWPARIPLLVWRVTRSLGGQRSPSRRRSPSVTPTATLTYAPTPRSGTAGPSRSWPATGASTGCRSQRSTVPLPSPPSSTPSTGVSCPSRRWTRSP